MPTKSRLNRIEQHVKTLGVKPRPQIDAVIVHGDGPAVTFDGPTCAADAKRYCDETYPDAEWLSVIKND